MGRGSTFFVGLEIVRGVMGRLYRSDAFIRFGMHKIHGNRGKITSYNAQMKEYNMFMYGCRKRHLLTGAHNSYNDGNASDLSAKTPQDATGRSSVA